MSMTRTLSPTESAAVLRVRWGAAIGARCDALGKKRSELADALDVSVQTLSRWIAGVVEPGTTEKLLIADALQVDVGELFAWE